MWAVLLQIPSFATTCMTVNQRFMVKSTLKCTKNKNIVYFSCSWTSQPVLAAAARFPSPSAAVSSSASRSRFVFGIFPGGRSRICHRPVWRFLPRLPSPGPPWWRTAGSGRDRTSPCSWTLRHTRGEVADSRGFYGPKCSFNRKQ